MRFFKLFVIFSLLFPVSLFAAHNQKIVLKDKSVIYGQVIGMQSGVYTIQTSSFGKIKLDSDKIESISNNTKKTCRPIQTIDRTERRNLGNQSSNTMPQEQINSTVRSKMSDGKFLNNLMDLSGNSDLNSVMSDPEVMKAISNNNYDYLMHNDKMKQLMNSPEIKDLLSNFE